MDKIIPKDWQEAEEERPALPSQDKINKQAAKLLAKPMYNTQLKDLIERHYLAKDIHLPSHMIAKAVRFVEEQNRPEPVREDIEA